MRGFLINKNLCFYYWLRKKIGEKWALTVAKGIERTILIFGRERIPHFNFNRNGTLTEEKELLTSGTPQDKPKRELIVDST